MRSFTDALGCDRWPSRGGRCPRGPAAGAATAITTRPRRRFTSSPGKVTFKIGDDVFVAERGTAVRIAPESVRSVHNDGPGEAELVICSKKVDDEAGGTVDDFWPDG
jgi:hypothetical protein